MSELPKNIEDQIEAVWLKSQRKLIDSKTDELEVLLRDGCSVEAAVSKVEDLNSVINEVCGKDEELYDMYRFRAFVKDSEMILLCRPKVVDEESHMYLVDGTLYNLCDYDEINVDVRRFKGGE